MHDCTFILFIFVCVASYNATPYGLSCLLEAHPLIILPLTDYDRYLFFIKKKRTTIMLLSLLTNVLARHGFVH